MGAHSARDTLPDAKEREGEREQEEAGRWGLPPVDGERRAQVGRASDCGSGSEKAQLAPLRPR